MFLQCSAETTKILSEIIWCVERFEHLRCKFSGTGDRNRWPVGAASLWRRAEPKWLQGCHFVPIDRLMHVSRQIFLTKSINKLFLTWPWLQQCPATFASGCAIGILVCYDSIPFYFICKADGHFLTSQISSSTRDHWVSTYLRHWYDKSISILPDTTQEFSFGSFEPHHGGSVRFFCFLCPTCMSNTAQSVSHPPQSRFTAPHLPVWNNGTRPPWEILGITRQHLEIIIRWRNKKRNQQQVVSECWFRWRLFQNEHSRGTRSNFTDKVITLLGCHWRTFHKYFVSKLVWLEFDQTQ